MPPSPEPQRRKRHMAVRLDHYIVVIGGSALESEHELLSNYKIWTYNICTEQWRKHNIQGLSKGGPAIDGACIAAIGKDLYMFGGRKIFCSKVMSTLIGAGVDVSAKTVWKLTKASKQKFICREIGFTFTRKKTPSPRFNHAGWEYSGNLWTFGGCALPPVFREWNDHGDFVNFCTNQLLCFNPQSKQWTNPKCYGLVPAPREKHATTSFGDKVWLFGGKKRRVIFDDLFELDMCTLMWTQIQVDLPKPKGRYFCSLSALSNSRIILHGGRNSQNVFCMSWVLDLPSLRWKYLKFIYHPREAHTASVGINSSTVIIGGLKGRHDTDNNTYSTVFHVMLEPKSLQQLAMKIIYKHGDVLPWQYLPQKLIDVLGIPEPEGSGVSLSCFSC